MKKFYRLNKIIFLVIIFLLFSFLNSTKAQIACDSSMENSECSQGGVCVNCPNGAPSYCGDLNGHFCIQDPSSCSLWQQYNYNIGRCDVIPCSYGSTSCPSGSVCNAPIGDSGHCVEESTFTPSAEHIVGGMGGSSCQTNNDCLSGFECIFVSMTEGKKCSTKKIEPQKTKTPDLNPLGKLNVKIPGIDELAAKYPIICNEEEVGKGGASCKIPWIAIYIYAVYNYLLGIGGFLAAIALMIGGVLWLISAGNASRVSQAKSWITGSLTGLLILLTSYVLLYEINPNLLLGKYIEVETIEGSIGDAQENVWAGSAFTPENVKGNANVKNRSQCINMLECDSEITFIRASTISEITENIIIQPGVDDRMTLNAIEGLKKASKKAKDKGLKLTISSIFRTQQKQCELWFDLGQDPWRVSPPGRCNSHMGGTAVDIGIVGLNTGGSDRHFRNENTKTLYDIMISAGWIRYCGEQWHFQYGDSQSFQCPGKGGHCTIIKDGVLQQAKNCQD